MIKHHRRSGLRGTHHGTARANVTIDTGQFRFGIYRFIGLNILTIKLFQQFDGRTQIVNLTAVRRGDVFDIGCSLVWECQVITGGMQTLPARGASSVDAKLIQHATHDMIFHIGDCGRMVVPAGTGESG